MARVGLPALDAVESVELRLQSSMLKHLDGHISILDANIPFYGSRFIPTPRVQGGFSCVNIKDT